MENGGLLAGPEDLILITGATGFIGSRLLRNLLDRGFRNLRCIARPSAKVADLEALAERLQPAARIEIVNGNLLSREDCIAAAKDAVIVYHLAAGRGEKSFPDAFMNSVVTTRNLLEACALHQSVRRFVNISSFAVYTNTNKPKRRRLDESCAVETHSSGDAYAFAKVKQDEIVREYGKKFGIPYAIVRPGYVYGSGNAAITGRVGIDTFGIFLHLGGSNSLPLTYVDNCADAIALAGLTPGVDNEVFNVVDDELPSSRQFLRSYKRNVRKFKSLYVPHVVSFALCGLWEWYSNWSDGQLPPSFTRKKWHSFWKKTRYSNAKLKQRLGWAPRVPTATGLRLYFEACRQGGRHA